MYPEDRVLVAVINRERDLAIAQREHWYRIPIQQAPDGVYAEYVAFFLSGAFKEQNGGVHYYARRTGVELARRRDLLPDEASHPRAGCLYHKLQFGELRRKEPPILNPTRRSVAFIFTTWDRFCAARTLADLYSDADQFVDRVFHALQQAGLRPQRIWEASRPASAGGAELRLPCADGAVVASTAPADDALLLKVDSSPDAIKAGVASVLDAVRARGGPATRQVRRGSASKGSPPQTSPEPSEPRPEG